MELSDYVVITVMAAVWIVIQLFKEPLLKKFDLMDYVPLIAGVLGILFTLWIHGHMDFSLFLQGIASGFSATGLNEGINGLFFKGED